MTCSLFRILKKPRLTKIHNFSSVSTTTGCPKLDPTLVNNKSPFCGFAFGVAFSKSVSEIYLTLLKSKKSLEVFCADMNFTPASV